MNFSYSALARDRQQVLASGTLSTRQPAGRRDRATRPRDEGAGLLLQSDAWVTVRTALLRSLRPYPEAREAMIAAMQQALGCDRP